VVSANGKTFKAWDAFLEVSEAVPILTNRKIEGTCISERGFFLKREVFAQIFSFQFSRTSVSRCTRDTNVSEREEE